MKKLIVLVISILAILALLDGIIHSRIVQSKALALFKESLQKTGWDVNIESIENAFPKLELTGVTVTAPDFVLSFGKLKSTFSFLRLLKNEIVFTNLIGDNVKWSIEKNLSPKEPLPTRTSKKFTLIINDFALTNAELFGDFFASVKGSFSVIEARNKALDFNANGTFVPLSDNLFFARNWSFSTKFVRFPDSTWEIQRARIDSDVAHVRGTAFFDAAGMLNKSSFFIQSNYIARVLANLEMKEEQNGIYKILGTWRAPNIEVQNQLIQNAQGQINAVLTKVGLEGETVSTANFLNQFWTAKTPLIWNRELGFSLPKIEIVAPAMTALASLQMIDRTKVNVEATFTIDQIHELFPNFYGGATGKMQWIDDEKNIVHLDAKITDAHYMDYSAKEIKIYSDLQNPFEEFAGNFVGDIKEGKWKNLFLQEASFDTVKVGENWPFSVFLSGIWQHPLLLDLDGFWSYNEENFLLTLQSASGTFFNHPLQLPKTASFAMSKDQMYLRDFSLVIADASIVAAVEKDSKKGAITLKVKELPIDFLSLNPLDVAVQGKFNLDLTCTEKGEDLHGDLFANFENLEMTLLGEKNPLRSEGVFESHFKRDRVNISGNLKVRETPLASIELSLPVHLEIWPLTFEPQYEDSVEGHFYLKGQVQEFLDFFNLGTHRLTGGCHCDLTLSNTLDNPHLSGFCNFINGYYQNYYTGTELQNIQANFEGKKDTLSLTNLSANDMQNKGAFNATGKIYLFPLENFPFSFDANFSRLNVATLDLITTEANGTIHFRGDLLSAFATGHLDIVESDIMVPARISKPLPELQVVYKNATAPPFIFEESKTPYPLHLDLSVDAPDGIFISGRGIDSEWRGQFQVSGTQTNIATRGQIELIRGTFNFSSRAFKLTEGSLVFSGVPNTDPYLKLTAEIQVKDILVTAHLQGPLNNPQVTLESSPPLPMGTILAYLLFGRDLTDISSVQALQLANSVSNLTGGSEQTTTITSDRVQIITIQNGGTEGGETVAVQVGKYDSNGVLVSYSQGAENTAGNISIEVEAEGNLSFIFESDQADDQKQGKFTLRWARTY